mmetsp:Transcript_19552/g.43693  ORF Transcript_19552/g.43693 Transcript_19552/m.43693 type:complete len:127 (-) Transcript_19552:475-855(-)
MPSQSVSMLPRYLLTRSRTHLPPQDHTFYIRAPRRSTSPYSPPLTTAHHAHSTPYELANDTMAAPEGWEQLAVFLPRATESSRVGGLNSPELAGMRAGAGAPEAVCRRPSSFAISILSGDPFPSTT